VCTCYVTRCVNPISFLTDWRRNSFSLNFSGSLDIWFILMYGTLTNKCSSGCPYIHKRIASILEKSSESHCKITQLTKIKHEKLRLCSSRKLGHSSQQFKVRDKYTDFHFLEPLLGALGWLDSHSVHTVCFFFFFGFNGLYWSLHCSYEVSRALSLIELQVKEYEWNWSHIVAEEEKRYLFIIPLH